MGVVTDMEKDGNPVLWVDTVWDPENVSGT